LDVTQRAGVAWLSPEAKSQASVDRHDGAPARTSSVSLTVAVEPAERALDLEDFLRTLAIEPLSEYVVFSIIVF
jgi:hypothetical protein